MNQEQYNRQWVAFFSQTGSEIAEISEQINKWPDIICTNKSIEQINKINSELLNACFSRIIFLPSRPSQLEYETALSKVQLTNHIITLHGYLRVLPSAICEAYHIYNGHPGDIVAYPELKGFNPQEKAFNSNIKTTGSVIHRVTAGVDEGPVVMRKRCDIDLHSLEKTYKILHNNSIKLWVEFFNK